MSAARSSTSRRTSFTRSAIGAAVVFGMTWAGSARPADFSQEKMPGSYAALMKMEPMEVMHMMDADHDGVVTKAEFMKFHEAMFDKLDRNRDGRLAEDEFVARTHTGP